MESIGDGFIVRGRITTPDGQPVGGLIVRARDRDLRTFQPLGVGPDAVTDADGRYEIRYSHKQFTRAEKGTADLVVRVFAPDAADLDRPVIQSETLFNAPPSAEINLVLPGDAGRPASEFERHLEAIAPLLTGQAADRSDVPLATVTDEDIAFIAGDTGIGPQHVVWLKTAFAFWTKTRSARAASHMLCDGKQVPAALFYGWFREGVPDRWDELIAQPIGTLRTAAVAAIANGIIPATLEAGLEASLNAMPNPQRQALRGTIAAAGLNEVARAVILRHAGEAPEVTNTLLARLVGDGTIAPADAHRAGLGIAVHGLAGGRQDAAVAIAGAKAARLNGSGLQRARDLSALDASEIEQALRTGNVAPPGGLTLAAYATQLEGRIADAFPTDAWLHRVSHVSPALVGAVDRMFPTSLRAAPRAGGPPSETDSELKAFINLHPGLGLRQVLADAPNAKTAVATIKERVGWVETVRSLNPDLDLLAVDYLPGSDSLQQVKFDGLSDDARSMVVANFKGFQRMRAAGAGTLDGMTLMAAGYRGATALARSQPSEIAERTGLPIGVAKAYHAKARRRANDTALTWFAFHDLERDARVLEHPTLPQPPAYLKQLAGYDQLFGSPNFCRCEHCRSVLGPAAYFVDLMYWVERNILNPSFKNHGGTGHSLHLHSRRSDLWTLPLTCDNTNMVVPTLDLVIDILEKFIVDEKGLASTAQLYERLATSDSSVRLPFSLPMERLSILLSHLGVSRSEIAKAFLLRAADAPARARIRLGMVPKQFQLITTSRLGDLSPATIGAAETFFMVWLKANLTLSTIPGQTETRALDAVGVLPFVNASGLDRATAITVLTSDFVNGTTAGAPARVMVEAGIGSSGAVQNDVELVRNLTSSRLDRFERFIRLWRHIPWTARELDYVITRLQKSVPPVVASAQNRLDEPIIIALADLLDVQDRFRLPVDELCGLCDQVPTVPLRGETSLFDRVFNQPPFVAQQGWPSATELILASSSNRTRLVAALQIGDQDLTTLTSGLDACLGRVQTDPRGNQTFTQGSWLNERNLSLLYAHARLARLLKLSIDQLLQTLSLTTALTARPAHQRCITSLADVQAVFEVHRWRTASGLSLPEALFVTTMRPSLAGYETPDSLATSIAGEVRTERLLHISEDLFTQIGLTQEESEDVISANAALFEPVPGEETFRIPRNIGVADVATSLIFNADPPASLFADVARELYRIVKRAGNAGFEPASLVALGLSQAEADALVAANLSSAANDGKPFERVQATPSRYRLRAGVSEATAIAAFGATPADIAATKSILRHRAIELVVRHHSQTVLAAKASAAAKTSPDKTRALLNLAMPTAAADRQALVDALQGGDLTPLSTVLDRLVRYAVLFKGAAFDSTALDFVRSSPAVLALVEPPTPETIRRVATYAALAGAPDPAYDPNAPAADSAALHTVLRWTFSIATATTDAQRARLAGAMRADVPLVTGVVTQIALTNGNAPAPRVDELRQLKTAIELTRRLSIPPETLRLTTSDDPAELARGADGAFAAVRAKYQDEQAFRQKLEPFEDKLRSRRRDGLVEFVLSAPDDATTDWRKRFSNANDLYHHFLTDVMVEGCTRTSKVVHAICSVQLYVHRVLMNLEQSDENPPAMVAHVDDPDRQEEWRWRKNYQVWVANRKVFLYPENYIEPGLRDDKTPLFEEVEDTLLQQPITEQNVLDAYAQYLHGFEEVAGLHIAGAYHDRQGTAGDVLHLFGVTSSDPPIYYYRTVRNLDNDAGPIFSAWKKIDLQIPVRKVSPVVFLGRLYVFWVEVTTRQVTVFVEGDSKFIAYRHSVRTKVSQLRLDGEWTAPLTLKVPGTVATALADVRLIDDPVLFQKITLKNGSEVFLQIDNDADQARYSQWAQAKLIAKVSLPYVVRWDPHGRQHASPLEEYSPEGWQWERVYPNVAGPTGSPHIAFKFAARTDGAPAGPPEVVDFWSATATRDSAPGVHETFEGMMVVEPKAGGTLHLHQSYYRHDDQGLPFHFATDRLYDNTVFAGQGLISAEGPLVQVPPRTDRQVLNGNTSSVVLEPPGESLLLLAKADGFELRSLGTSLVRTMGQTLAIQRIPGLLATAFQESAQMKEAPSAASIVSTTGNVTSRGVSTAGARAEWTGNDNAYLPYYREVFFQIPFLIADHFNSQQKFADAQRWYHYLYDPTAREATPDDRKRVWRYREFREVAIQNLRQALTNRDALAAYRRDPFNPHSIARLRPGAYQKSIFMKYVDNLLDWGDSLFSQFTMESVNEATMLYVMAADILGPRPTELGPCGETSATPKTYEDIAPLLRPADPNEESTAEVLIEELETFTIDFPDLATADQFVIDGFRTQTAQAPAMMSRSFALLAGPGMPVGGGGTDPYGQPGDPLGWNTAGARTWQDKSGTPLSVLSSGDSIDGGMTFEVGGQGTLTLPLSGDPVGPPETPPNVDVLSLHNTIRGSVGAPKGFDPSDYMNLKYDLGDAPPRRERPPEQIPPQFEPFELTHARIVFCIPENKELRSYWDRVEDRLNKIRNCRDISGVRRRLELFAPEIDPRLLVRMRAAGLSLDDVMNVTSGNVPPYRFTYLIDKAKQQAGVVQTFGNQLLTALEKRDAEELTRLRTVHEQNLLKLRSQVMQSEIEAAEDTRDSLKRQRASAEHRRDHYTELHNRGLSAPETTQLALQTTAAGLRNLASIFNVAMGIASLIPQVGAPTSMKYGGVEFHNMFDGVATALKDHSDAIQAVATAAGTLATYERRDQDWKFQISAANKDIDQLDKQIAAAEIRRDIAIASQKVHERTIEQVQEIFDFLRDRFTNFGRYTFLAAELQKLHRMAFNAALSMARLAEQACHFEHPDEAVKPVLAGDYWDAGNAGLLAGDRLVIDLHNLERRYIETHHRTLEIEQSFSLARFDPDALSTLKTDCTCDFEVPEWFFDLTYPGHYRRRIKGVRLTMPCLVGPHANVGATLRLTGSSVRKEPTLDSEVPVPLRHVTAIAASMGQSDAGVFEFSFRDERYMPFEGAGASSAWTLSLPKTVKPFDYRTISDVILRISYTAEENDGLRGATELATGVLATLTSEAITRALSMRDDFPDAWHMLVEGAAQVDIDIREVHVPFFMSAFDLAPAAFDVLVGTLADPMAVYPTVSIDGQAAATPGADSDSGLYRLGSTPALTVLTKHTLKITDLASASRPTPGGGTRLDESKIKDIVLRVPLKRQPPAP